MRFETMLAIAAILSPFALGAPTGELDPFCFLRVLYALGLTCRVLSLAEAAVDYMRLGKKSPEPEVDYMRLGMQSPEVD